MDDFVLKEIASDAIDHAVEKAETYRLLNDPEQAESICLDVLKIRPDHQQTLRNIVLALTDQFGQTSSKIKAAKTHTMRLSDEYERHYFCGLVAEREARALLRQRFFEPSCAKHLLLDPSKRFAWEVSKVVLSRDVCFCYFFMDL